ncbi:hypothetical protein ONZ45_g7249 [Pleurotus djamor]|nr:hypothetical protein ONZ45_g7249 [Pleurotus djamor]
MDAAASTITIAGAISNLPPEILPYIFLHLIDGIRRTDLLHLCQVCKSWLPIAQPILYRSVTIRNFQIHKFINTIEEKRDLAPLIKHLTLDRWDTHTDWVSVHKILKVLSPHERLLSFHVPVTTHIYLENVDLIQSISLLSFLGHLDVDINIFESLHAVKQFIASFPQLHTLDANDEDGPDYDEEEWLDGLPSDVPIEFPPTIRRLGYHLGTRELLEAFLQWVPRDTEILESLSVTISPENSHASLGSTLRSFGAALTSLNLVYQWRADLPSIDLRENPNLRSLIITIEPHDPLAAYVKEQLSTLLKTLSSASLQIVEFNLLLGSEMLPHLHFMDWGVLDEAAGNADVWVSVLCREKSHMAGVEEEIGSQMPRHRAQRKLGLSPQFFSYSPPIFRSRPADNSTIVHSRTIPFIPTCLWLVPLVHPTSQPTDLRFHGSGRGLGEEWVIIDINDGTIWTYAAVGAVAAVSGAFLAAQDAAAPMYECGNLKQRLPVFDDDDPVHRFSPTNSPSVQVYVPPPNDIQSRGAGAGHLRCAALVPEKQMLIIAGAGVLRPMAIVPCAQETEDEDQYRWDGWKVNVLGGVRS